MIRPWIQLGLVLLLVPLARATPAGFTTDFAAAQAQAAREGKHLFVNFGGSDWCAACIQLERDVFTKPEFVQQFGDRFVLVDIDRPLRAPAKSKFTPAQLADFDRLRVQYGVIYFPSVFLMDEKGRPYALTTYKERGLDLFSAHLEKIIVSHSRGPRLIAEAATLSGEERATRLAQGLAAIGSDIVLTHFGSSVVELDLAAQGDPTGYLAYLRLRRAFRAWEIGFLKHWDKRPIAAAADGFMRAFHPGGVTARQVLTLQLVGELEEDRMTDALATARRLLAPSRESAWEETALFPGLESALPELTDLLHRAAEAHAAGSGESARWLEKFLHVLPEDPLAANCADVEHLRNRALIPLQRRYGQWLLDSTAGLPEAGRARVWTEALLGTSYYRYAPIEGIVNQIHRISPDEFKRLPNFYLRWPEYYKP